MWTKTSPQELDGKILMVLRAEGSCPQYVQGVDEDQGARKMLPAFGDGVLHLVQPCVQLLDHITVAVTHLAAPSEKEIICWLPHGLRRWGRGAIRAQLGWMASKQAITHPRISTILRKITPKFP